MNERLKPRILHLEDNQDWVTEIKSILGEEYEVVGCATPCRLQLHFWIQTYLISP